MSGNRIISPDILDTEIFDAQELSSDGYSSYLTLPLVSISSGIFTVDPTGVLSGGITIDPEFPVESGDRVYVEGATPGSVDGYYTIFEILSDTTFDIEESVVNSTGGNISFFHPSGASRIGVNTDNFIQISSSNVQDALEELDAAVAAGGITEGQHEALDTLVHNIAESSFEEGTYSGPFNRLSNVTIWTDGTKTTKIREVNFTYTGARVTTVVTIQYDEFGIAQDTLTETITYVGPFTNRIDTVTRVKS